MYLGSWDIDDYLPIPVICHRFSSGAAYAPTALTYSIYEDGGTTGLYEDVDMTPASPFDAQTGAYLARRQLTAAGGFERGKNYTVLVKATVDSVTAATWHTFQIAARVDTRAVAGTTQSAGDLWTQLDSASTAIARLTALLETSDGSERFKVHALSACPVDYPTDVTLDGNGRPTEVVMASDSTKKLVYTYTADNIVPDSVTKVAV